MELTNTEEKIINTFSKQMELPHLDKVKLIYGLRLVFMDFKKLIFMYTVAFLIGCFIETLLIHASFFVFRQVAFGVHSQNFYVCLIVSSITFPTTAFLLINLKLSTNYIWIIYLIAAIPLLLFAPLGSAVNAIRGKKHVLYLRKRICLRLGILGVIVLFIPSTITKFLVTGLLIEAITIMISLIQKED